jgi:hypothetical protein
MRKRTIILLVLGAVLAALGGGIAGVVLVAMANPGVKGPLVSNDALVVGFATGAVVGGGLVVGIFRLRTRPRRTPPWMDDGAP